MGGNLKNDYKPTEEPIIPLLEQHSEKNLETPENSAISSHDSDNYIIDENFIKRKNTSSYHMDNQLNHQNSKDRPTTSKNNKSTQVLRFVFVSVYSHFKSIS